VRFGGPNSLASNLVHFLDHGGTLSRVSKEHTEIVQDVLRESGREFSLQAIAKAYQVSERWWDENQNRLPRGRRKSLLVESTAVLLEKLSVGDSRSLAEKIQSEWHVRVGFRLYPDTIPCLEQLRKRGIPMGIITQNLDTDAEFRDHALRINGIGEYFSVVATSESIGYDKPDPRLFLGAADRTGFSPESILHVGDKVELDVAGAKASGMQAVLIDRSGIANQGQERGRVISSLSELSVN